MNLAEGVHVTENVRLTRPLGEGGMARLWVAEHLALRTEVAVKFIAPELVAQSPELVTRFNREATAVASIKSPHVVQILDHGMAEDGTPYIVMELLDGEDLGHRLDRTGSVPLADAVTIVAQVAKALGKAHAAGVIHRDIKPDNIFLVRNDDEEELFVKVLDFGVAKQTAVSSYSVVTATGTMVGTPAYMSPEQILSGKHVDLKTDLWSLGVVAYHMLTGDIPFHGETLGALCVAISKGVYKSPSQQNPALPAAIDAWVTRALAPHPDDRFGSVKEMADALRDAAAGVAPPHVLAATEPQQKTLDSPASLREMDLAEHAATAPFVRPKNITTDSLDAALSEGMGESLIGLRRRRALPWLAGGLVVIGGSVAALVFSRPSGDDRGSRPTTNASMPGGVPSGETPQRSASAPSATTPRVENSAPTSSASASPSTAVASATASDRVATSPRPTPPAPPPRVTPPPAPPVAPPPPPPSKPKGKDRGF
jgi:serine/threonine-protein kinase